MRDLKSEVGSNLTLVLVCAYSHCICCIMQAADSSQEAEVMKISSTGVADQEKSATASTEGQKTDDENKVIAAQLLS